MIASINYQMKIMSYASYKSRLTGKDSVAAKDWKQKEKRATENERVDRITNSMVMNLSKLWEPWRTEDPGVLQSTGSQRVRRDLATQQQQQQLLIDSFSNV